jgi:hypothetical protein
MVRIVVCFLMVVLMCSCRSTKYVPVETKVTETVEMHDTVTQVQLVPYYSESVRQDTMSSRLVNPYAYSDAYWDGKQLHHTLGIWPGTTIPVTIPDYKIITRTEVRNKVVEVEKKLSAYQAFRIRYFWMSVILNAILIFWIIRTKVRTKDSE